ncbi:MAG: biotin/lipoyl-binding protein [Gammaproteobacteria bacterium]|nr:biotin/lipoyl-binding protein [Gammaproteobacteria bacterium]
MLSPSTEVVDSSLQEQLKMPWLGLRSDLKIYPAPLNQGARSWVVEDPVSGQHYQLGVEEGEFFLHLSREPNLDAALLAFIKNTSFRPSLVDILAFIERLQQEGLALLPLEDQLSRATETSSAAGSFAQRLLHGYVYFRIPLLRPDRFLSRTYSSVAWLWSAGMRAFYLLAGLLGLLLSFQQYEYYADSSSFLFTPNGLLGFALSLVVLKIGHEFCHAYATKSLGLQVRSMGVALILLWPVLYTDTSDAWKLSSLRQRLKISSAGVLFELVVAGIALLLWAVLPDGLWRSLMFFLSSTSLASSLLINLNPFMRFDGYYLLMDWWGVDNLQPRAFALLRHRVRCWLVDWQGAVPEQHPQQRRLVIYAALTLVYRLVLALTIALLVYHMTFPALGLLLLVVELWIFILRPLWSEVRDLYQQRALWGEPYYLWRSGILLGVLLLMFALPLPSMERLPALVLYENSQRLHAPAAGKLVVWRVRLGQRVQRGDLLAQLQDERLQKQRVTNQFDLKMVELRLSQSSNGGEQGGYRHWLLAEKARLLAALATLRSAEQLLQVRSGREGWVVALNERLRAGVFVAKKSHLLTVASDQEVTVTAYMTEALRSQMPPLAELRSRLLLPELGWFDLRATALSPLPVRRLPNQSLYDFAGGPLVALRQGGKVEPKEAQFALQLKLESRPLNLSHGERAWVWTLHRGDALLSRFAAWFVQQLK